MNHPIQPLEKDVHGIIRFKENKIVTYLLDNGGIDLNQLARFEFSQNDQEQFAQLIGYSISGFSELSYVSDEVYDEADGMATKLRNQNELSQHLDNTIAGVEGCKEHHGVES